MTEEDRVWARADGQDLLVRLYWPDGGAPHQQSSAAALPAIIDVHGGAWSSGDRSAGELYNRHLANAGFLVAAIDFRQAPAHRHPAASCDVVAAVRWLRLNAVALGANSTNIDSTNIGLIGSSSGGHLAMLAATRHAAAEHRGTLILDCEGNAAAHDELDASVAYVIALWPVSDPLFRYRYAKRAGIARLVAGHDAYYTNEAQMRDASVPRLVAAGEAQSLPPLFVVQPGEDGNVPVEMTFDLLRAWQARGGKLEYAYFPDMPHAFGHRASAATSDMLEQVTDFARRRTAGGKHRRE